LSIDNVNYLICNDAVVAEVRRHGVATLAPDSKNLDPVLAVLPR
jgi:hypothetical protein